MRYLLMLSLIVGLIGCEGLSDKQHTRSTRTGISVEDFSSLFINSETGKLLEFEACGEGFKDECEIFTDQFQTVAVKEIIVIDSIRKDNTTCCRTIIIGGKKIQRCREFPDSITRCPANWYNLN